MLINEILWPYERIEHISKHNVQPYEVEEVCFGKSLVLKTKNVGENNVYFVLGQTQAGRYLLCLIIHFPNGKAYPITARDMTEKERKKFLQWSNK